MTERKFRKAGGPVLPTGTPFRLPRAGGLQCQRASKPGSGKAAPTAKTTAVPMTALRGLGHLQTRPHFPPTPPHRGGIAALFYPRGSQAGRAVGGTGHSRDMGLSPAQLSRAPSYPRNPSLPRQQGLLEVHPLLLGNRGSLAYAKGSFLGDGLFWQRSSGSRPSQPGDRCCSFPEPPL